MSREGIEVEIESVTRKEREATRGQALSECVDEQMEQMRHVLRSRTELKHRQNRASGDQWPARATALVWRFAAGCAVRPAGGEGCAGRGKQRSCKLSACLPARVSQEVIVA